MNSLSKAYEFYARHIYDEEKMQLLETHKLKTAGSVASVLWELFGSILTERYGAGDTGSDLQGWEVKSALGTGSYEYQYHLNTGLEKLREDCLVNHLFCSYSETYKDVVVKAMTGPGLAGKYFKVWEPEYVKNYDSRIPKELRRQRFRKSIPYGYVQDSGVLILRIEEGLLVDSDDDALKKFNSR